jgi:hypothetical protein
MSDVATNPAGITGGEFYVTGGTLRPDAPSYIERQADKELCDGLLRGEFCYVLTSRQMGKSSLMVRTVKRLREEGVAVAVLDLTAIGQNLTIEQWYDGLISRLGQQLDLEEELLDFWQQHPEWGPLQRWTTALEQVVLTRLSSKVVIFVDEIDIVRSLPFSTDEFFAAIRECYNRRSREVAFGRLAFGLLGVATPNDLIRDTRMTPFNIGRRIELNDFTTREASVLERGLGASEQVSKELLARVLYWTGGHPYLTQRLCRALAEALCTPEIEAESGLAVPPLLPDSSNVDLLAEKLFLSRQARDRDDNLIFVRERILRSEMDVPALLYLYRKIHNGQLVPDDETNPLVSILRLSGITRGVDGYLQVRNRIYWQVFDPNWIQTNMPEAEVRRQRKAGRRGMFVGFAIAVILLLAYIFLGPVLTRYRKARLAQRTVARVESTYRQLKSYRDNFETTIDLGVGGTIVPISGSGSLLFVKPNKVNLTLKSSMNLPEIELRLLSDGNNSCVYAPLLNQYQILDSPPSPTPFDLPASLAPQVGPLRVLPLYRLLLLPSKGDSALKSAHDIQFDETTELNREPVHVIHWRQGAMPFLSALGLTNGISEHDYIPVTAWVNTTNDLIVQLRIDLSDWAKEIMGRRPEFPVTGLAITESHSSIETTPLSSSSSNMFSLEFSDGPRPVTRLDLPQPNFATLVAPRRQFAKLIPARLTQATSNLIDLTDYYNASLVQSWHGGPRNNTLDVLPSGLLQFGGSVFDVRGIVQLSGRGLQGAGGRFPQQISGIRVAQTCRQLHFLHATGWPEREGTRVGTYLVHYVDDRTQAIPIVYGDDLRDWSAEADRSYKIKRGEVVWSAINKAHVPVRLFKTTWTNPWPTTEITSIDYLSTMAEAAPFLLAITAGP